MTKPAARAMQDGASHQGPRPRLFRGLVITATDSPISLFWSLTSHGALGRSLGSSARSGEGFFYVATRGHERTDRDRQEPTKGRPNARPEPVAAWRRGTD